MSTDKANTKNILIIDPALNCAYDIFAADLQDFKTIFPAENQDIEFYEDLLERIGGEAVDRLHTRIFRNPVAKPDANGIHGTLFYDLPEKKEYYPNKRDSDLDGVGRGWRHAENVGDKN